MLLFLLWRRICFRPGTINFALRFFFIKETQNCNYFINFSQFFVSTSRLRRRDFGKFTSFLIICILQEERIRIRRKSSLPSQAQNSFLQPRSGSTRKTSELFVQAKKKTLINHFVRSLTLFENPKIVQLANKVRYPRLQRRYLYLPYLLL